jgi:hypothetical protein
MSNRYEPRRYDDVDEMVTDPGETLAEAIECITRDAKDLSDNLGKQVKYLATRHRLAVEMMALEKGATYSNEDVGKAGRSAQGDRHPYRRTQLYTWF